jgi:hypothetical protein
MAATARITALHTTGRRTIAPRMLDLLLDWADCTRTVMVAATDTRRRSIGATAVVTVGARAAVLLAVTQIKVILASQLLIQTCL